MPDINTRYYRIYGDKTPFVQNNYHTEKDISCFKNMFASASSLPNNRLINNNKSTGQQLIIRNTTQHPAWIHQIIFSLISS